MMLRELDDWKGALEMPTAYVRLVHTLHMTFSLKEQSGVNLWMVEGGRVVISHEKRLSKDRQHLRGHMPRWLL